MPETPSIADNLNQLRQWCDECAAHPEKERTAKGLTGLQHVLDVVAIIQKVGEQTRTVDQKKLRLFLESVKSTKSFSRLQPQERHVVNAALRALKFSGITIGLRLVDWIIEICKDIFFFISHARIPVDERKFLLSNISTLRTLFRNQVKKSADHTITDSDLKQGLALLDEWVNELLHQKKQRLSNVTKQYLHSIQSEVTAIKQQAEEAWAARPGTPIIITKTPPSEPEPPLSLGAKISLLASRGAMTPGAVLKLLEPEGLPLMASTGEATIWDRIAEIPSALLSSHASMCAICFVRLKQRSPPLPSMHNEGCAFMLNEPIFFSLTHRRRIWMI